MRVATPLEELTEKEWKTQLLQLATTLGWRHYFTWRSKHSPAGFPDLVLVRDRVIFVELKTEKGKLSDAQQDWISVLQIAARAEVYVWRPRDLEQVADVLQRRA